MSKICDLRRCPTYCVKGREGELVKGAVTVTITSESPNGRTDLRACAETIQELNRMNVMSGSAAIDGHNEMAIQT